MMRLGGYVGILALGWFSVTYGRLSIADLTYNDQEDENEDDDDIPESDDESGKALDICAAETKISLWALVVFCSHTRC